MRYQTPKGYAQHPANWFYIRGIGPVSRYLPSAVGPEYAACGVFLVITEELQWQTDTDPAEVAWAIAPENELSASTRELLRGQIPNHPWSECKDSLDGRQE